MMASSYPSLLPRFSQNPQALGSQINGFYAKKAETHTHPSLLLLHHRRLFSHLIPFLCLSTRAQQPSEEPFVAQYLISSFGFSADRALRLAATPRLRPIKSLDRPDSVVNFFKEIGLSDSQIKSVISWHPQLLSYSVDKTLKPRALELKSNGFSEQTIIQLILYNTSALKYKSTLSRLQFWRNFVGNDEPSLLKVIRANFDLLKHDIDKRIIPNINLLKEYGLSDQEVMKVIMKVKKLISYRPEAIKKLLKETEELGFKRGSGMFIEGLFVLVSLKKETVCRKVEFFKKMYGWSDKDVNIALRKCPGILRFSEENIKCKMDFLVKKAGFHPKDVVSKPILLARSIEGTLAPRHRVLTVLKEKGVKISCSFYTASFWSESQFWEKFILPYEKEVPEIGKIYAAASSGKVKI